MENVIDVRDKKREKTFLGVCITPRKCVLFFELFQIFSEICQSHVALLQEGIVHGEGGTHALWLVALLGKLQILSEHRTVIWMRTVFDNLLGTAQWTLATEIGYTLFGDNHIHIVLGTVHVTAHRNDGRDATVLGGTLCGEDRDVTIALVIAGTADTIHQLAAADMTGVFVAIDIALDGGVHGDDTQTADHLRRVRNLALADGEMLLEVFNIIIHLF